MIVDEYFSKFYATYFIYDIFKWSLKKHDVYFIFEE